MNSILMKISKRVIFFCFIACIAIFYFMSPTVAMAGDLNDLGINDDTIASTTHPTVIEEPGSAETPDDLRDLNVSNGLSITYRDEEGNLSGALRILITLTLVTLIPTIKED